jgi:hypothetical protein
MMLVHHSRDTAEKQLDETRVFALQGMNQVMRTFLQVTHTFPTFFASCWCARYGCQSYCFGFDCV